LRTETWALAAAIIQGDIDMLNELESESLGENESAIGDYGNVTLGGQLREKITFADIETSRNELEAQRGTPGAFENFRERFSTFFDNLLKRQDSGFPLEELPMDLNMMRMYVSLACRLSFYITLLILRQIIEYRFLKSYYDSMVYWKIKIDYLRCNPSFHGRPRFDCVIVYRGDGYYFARLLYLFTYNFQGTAFPIALIQPYEDVHPLRKKDQELRLHRLRPKKRRDTSIFISARSIRRGAFLVPALDHPNDLIVVDVIDTDMFLRIKAIYPAG
jgi:hypothetical protein